ncbi:MAG TPA: hypothetical protein VFP59_00970 [Candidatus Angelobacter sp.]|nr:hypothetical protein [Candidatus Angelobacter sp.]
MALKLRFVLPAIQVILAASLLIIGAAQHKADRGKDIYYGAPAERVCYAINAPALLFRSAGLYLWHTTDFPMVNDAVDNGIFMIGVVLLWFLVGATIESRLKGCHKTALSRPWRLAIDFFLIVVGIAFVLVGVGAWNLVHLGSTLQGFAEAAIYFLWAMVLVLISGRDLRVLSTNR